jgi:hypothetical protein
MAGKLGIKELLVAAFLLTMSIMVTIFACTLVADSNAYPMAPLMFYIFAPVPFFLCGVPKRDDGGFMGGSGQSAGGMMANVSHFLTGLFAAGGPSMSLVLYHTELIGWPALVMSLLSAFLLVCSCAVVHFSHQAGREDAF